MGYNVIRSILLLGGLAAGSAALAADLPSPAMLGNTCAGCHGTNGSSMGPATPSIAGITPDYFVDTMMSYKNGERASTIMGRIAKGYSDEEIKAMADFFSDKPFLRQAQTHDADKADLGRKLHKKYCEKCHEEGGAKADEGGILAGQWMTYLDYAFEDFQSGARPTPKKMGRQMEKLIADQGDEGIEALVNYYGSRQ